MSMLRYLRPAIMAGLSLVASAAMALELPIGGQYGDFCGGSRQSWGLAADNPSLWASPMVAFSWGITGAASNGPYFNCHYLSSNELPRELAESMSGGLRARGWVAAATCEGLRPVETFVVLAFLDTKTKQPMLRIKRGDDHKSAVDLGLCPVSVMATPPK